MPDTAKKHFIPLASKYVCKDSEIEDNVPISQRSKLSLAGFSYSGFRSRDMTP